MRGLRALVVSTLVALAAVPETAAAGQVKETFANLTGLFLQILLHESGHAAAAAGVGWHIDEFRPYPNICGGRLVGGCVLIHTDEPVFEDDGTMNRRRLVQGRQIAAAGSMTSNLSVLAFSPLQRVFRPAGFAGMTLGHMLTYQNYDWLFYTVVDSVSSFQGDWYAIAQSLDVPVYYFVAPAALNYWLLKKYREAFARKTPAPSARGKDAAAAPPMPAVFWPSPVVTEDGAFGLAMNFATEVP